MDYDPNHVQNHARFLLGVKVLVVDENGKVLILKRSDRVSRAHGWDFPGGGVDKGESPNDAATREISEETGLTVNQLRLTTTYLANTDGEDDLIIGYTATIDEGQVKLAGWEHDDFQWASLNDLKKIKLPKEHSAILEAYMSGL